MSDLSTRINKLLLNLQSGDSQSLGKLYNLTAGHLLVVARSALRDKSLDKDVVQEAFLKVFKSADTYKKDSGGYAWLRKIVQTTAYTFNDEGKLKAEYDVETIPSKENIVDAVDLRTDLGRAMERLDSVDVQLLYQYFFLGYSYYEICKKTGMPKPTVFKRIKLALKDLKTFLKR